ncbi:hypothetical protein QUW56_13600 [Phocaeicola barnesiae]|uniref:hypothetical protein n=1 Tax=Phocaeicola barnesiae TaxID=376804 RepID=UPI0025A33FF5|nr:hypothetical protein [Phocaeicola barnesiae]MDM8234398.1 hypothetical protein [Phocaeicola barnesiae]
MRRIAKMPLWAESRIHGDVYVRFGGRLSETYHRKVAWRRQPSLQVTDDKISEDMDRLTMNNRQSVNLFFSLSPSRGKRAGN